MSTQQFQPDFYHHPAQNPTGDTGYKVGLRPVQFDIPQQKEVQVNPTSSKVESDTKPAPVTSKKRKNFFTPLTISLSLLVIAALFFTFAGLNVYASNRKADQEKNLLECNNILNKAKITGTAPDDLNCETKIGWENLFGEDNSLLITQEIKNRVQARETELTDKNTALKAQIQDLETDLKNLDVEFTQEVSELKLGDNLQTNQTLLEGYLQNLTTLRQTNFAKVTDLIETYQKLLSSAKNTDVAAETAELQSYKALTDNQKIEKYSSFKETYQVLENKLNSVNSIGKPGSGEFKIFTPAEFQRLYDAFSYTGVNPITTSPAITGDQKADERIISIAQKRGYKLRSEAIYSKLESSDGQMMQPQARQAWNQLKEAASKDGIKIGNVSSFRSVSLQKDLFTQRFQEESIKQIGRNYTPAEIASGTADEAINNVLITSSIPGYSKHHTGYTIDVTDLTSGKPFTAFANTAAYKWMSDNNYYNAKKYGFIPSYPAGGTNFGPDPESWEYVWIGTDTLKK
jgi:LAS superfamily LD-carboxypeptidase LdcB